MRKAIPFIYFAFTSISLCAQSSVTNIRYQNSVRYILNSNAYKSYAKQTGIYKLNVSSELAPFEIMAHPFYTDLQNKFKIDVDSVFNKSYDVYLEKKCIIDGLKHLSQSKSSKLKLYLSEIRGNILFAELKHVSSKKEKYYSVQYSGLVIAFMFLFKDDNIGECLIAEVHYEPF